MFTVHTDLLTKRIHSNFSHNLNPTASLRKQLSNGGLEGRDFVGVGHDGGDPARVG